MSTVAYGYDPAGNRNDLKLGGATFTTYAYDDDSLLDTITHGTKVFDPGYDQDHRRTSLAYPNGITTTYGYDDRSQLTSLDVKLGATVVTQFGYQYDDAGNRTVKTTPELTETYGYDALYRLTHVTRTGIAGVWVYGYDKVGNRTSEQSNTRVVQASHNTRNQLYQTLAGWPLRWRGTLSEAGNVTFTSATVNGLPAKMIDGTTFEATILASPGTNNVTVKATDSSNNTRTSNYRVDVTGTSDILTYDPAGNLLTRTDGVDTWRYGWNAENQLLRACKNASPCTDANATARFKYDGLGRRVQKVAGGVTTSFLYDGEDILEQTSGGVVTRYVHGPGVDQPLAQTDGSGTVTGYFHADGLGSIVAMTNSSGTVTSTRRYDPFGNLEVGAANGGYAFTGREWDPETGLYYYRARYFDPKLGRFISEDPIGLRDGLNRYAYVANNTINRVDPLGLYAKDVHYYVTRQLAAEAGFNIQQAEWIARGDQDMDDLANFSPWTSRSNRTKYHFTTEARRCEMRDEAFREKSWWKFGSYLHVLQDSYSHQRGKADRDGKPYGVGIGHGWTPHPDRPEERPELYQKMLDKTRTEMAEFFKIINEEGLTEVGQ